jgi:hypothetical protein
MGLLKKEEKKFVYIENDRGSCFSIENLRELFISRERESYPEGRVSIYSLSLGYTTGSSIEIYSSHNLQDVIDFRDEIIKKADISLVKCPFSIRTLGFIGV